MLRFLAVPAACLALAAPARAQGAHPVAHYVSLPVEAGPGLGAGSGQPGPQRADPRRAEPEAARTTSALKGPDPAKIPDAAPRPWCPPERRVGRGAGFCLVN